MQARNTFALQRVVAVLNNSSPRWLLTLLLPPANPPRNDDKSNPVLSMVKSNKPLMSKLIPLEEVLTFPDLASIIISLTLSKLVFN